MTDKEEFERRNKSVLAMSKIARKLKINDVSHVYLITMFKTYKHMIDSFDPSVIKHNLNEIEEGYAILMEQLRKYADDHKKSVVTLH